MKSITQILMTRFVTHEVKQFVVQRPENFSCLPGQGVLVAINQPGLEKDWHPFTPTSLADDKVLEFTIKGYPHGGMTEKLHRLNVGDELWLGKVFGTILYKGPGVFIAGGAGITPFMAIFRQLYRNNQLAGNSLLFSNKTHADIIAEKEMSHYLGQNCIFTLTRESVAGYQHGRINRDFLLKQLKSFDRRFYLCGPEKFVEDCSDSLKTLGAHSDSIVFEEE